MKTQFTAPLKNILTGLHNQSFSEIDQLYDDLSELIEFTIQHAINSGCSIEELAKTLDLDQYLKDGMPKSSIRVLTWTLTNDICTTLLRSDKHKMTNVRSH